MDIIRRVVLLIAVQCLAACAWAAGSGAGDIEYQIKAAYLYKFAAYVEWPSAAFAEANTPVIIAVVGADDVAAALNNIKAGQMVNNRAVQVKLLKPGDPLTGVQILFIGRQESGHLRRWLDSVQAQPVLTVTEWAGALGVGSVINFVPVDDRIRFEVSAVSAERSGLKISARLLSVAQKVETRRP